MKTLYNNLKQNLNDYESILAFEELINSLNAQEKEYLIH